MSEKTKKYTERKFIFPLLLFFFAQFFKFTGKITDFYWLLASGVPVVGFHTLYYFLAKLNGSNNNGKPIQ